jgi:hypothetical protein
MLLKSPAGKQPSKMSNMDTRSIYRYEDTSAQDKSKVCRGNRAKLYVTTPQVKMEFAY